MHDSWDGSSDQTDDQVD